MRLGIAGLAKSGKTTIFNAITRLDAPMSVYDSKIEPNMGVVEVADERIDHLSQIYQPKKTIYTHVEFIDFPGMATDTAEHEFLSTTSMSLLKTTDALVVTLRHFTNPTLDVTLGTPDPEKDFRHIIEEFLLSDMVIAEKRLEKIELGYKRGIRTPALQIEEKAIKMAIDSLNNETPLKEVAFTEEELKSIKGFQFLTLKPVMIILNSDENNFAQNSALIGRLSKFAPTYEMAGKFEMELGKLEPEDASTFMADIGISESAVKGVIKVAYSLLGYISFFTVGPDEVRAWTIQNGDTALIAAGKIHSDLARGFIRAETFCYDDILTHKNEKTIREKGLFRLEGKTYQVKDGDILNIRFNV